MSRTALAATLLCSCSFAFIGCATGGGPAHRVGAGLAPAALTGVPLLEQARAAADGAVVYVSDRSGGYEVWTARGGTELQLSRLGEVTEHPRVSPDGRTVIFSADQGGDEVYDLWRVGLHGDAVQRLTDTPDVSESGAEYSPDGSQLALLADPGTPFQPQLFVMDLATGERRQLTRGEVPVWRPVWSPDGRRIAVTRTGDWSHGDLLVVDVESGAVVEVAPPEHGGILWAQAFTDPDTVLATTGNEKGFTQLARAGLAPVSVERFGPGDWDVEAVDWHPAAGAVFTRNVSGRSGLYRLRTPDGALEELMPPLGVVGSVSVSAAGSWVVFDRRDSSAPAEVYRLHIERGELEQVTRSAPAGLDVRRLVGAQPFEVESFDGQRIAGFVYAPAGPGPHPAVVFVHGGPDSQSRDRYDADRQTLVQAGYVVLDANYRGSTGYGRAFQNADDFDWGGGDRKDLRAVVEHFVASGLVDRGRVAIMGGSFGGYMALLAVLLDNDLYRACVDLYGMPDLVQDYEMTKDRFGDWYRAEMGTPDDRAELFRERSPVTHLSRLQAPLLIFHGANDSNVPQAQSDSLVEAVKRQGGDVDYVVYPDEGHVFTKRRNRLDVLQRVTSFLGSKL